MLTIGTPDLACDFSSIAAVTKQRAHDDDDGDDDDDDDALNLTRFVPTPTARFS